MKSIEINNIKDFTTRLFAGTDFDEYLLQEAQFTTACTFTIDGHINPDFVGEEEMKLPENSEGMAQWKRLRPICYEIIKGKKVPRQFTVVLRCPAARIPAFLQASSISTRPEDISGLYLNIHFRQGRLYCTTGCSLKTFSLDRRTENAWDEYMSQALKPFC